MKFSGGLVLLAVFSVGPAFGHLQLQLRKKAGEKERVLPETCISAELGSVDFVTPTDSMAYDVARKQWASTMASSEISERRIHPDAIVFAKNDNDVLAAIVAARTCDYKISVRSGGHNYGGYSSCEAGTDCIQIDVSALKNFEHQTGTTFVTIGAGLNLGEVIPMLGSIEAPGPLMIPMGICNFIGLGGHFQSSALGLFARTFGLGMDHVTSFRIATADGMILDVSPESHGDLYWAVLGGSPGSWGVVLDYTIKAIESLDYPNANAGVFRWLYDHDTFVALANKYNEIATREETAKDLMFWLTVGAPEEIRLDPAYAEKPYIPHVINLFFMWTGIENGPLPGDNFNNFILPFLLIGNPVPLGDPTQVYPLHVSQFLLRFDYDFQGRRYHVHSMILEGDLDDEFIEQVATEIDERLEIPYLLTEFQILSPGGTGDGSQFNLNAGQNSFPTRDATFTIDDWIFFPDDTLEETVRGRIKDFRQETKTTWKNPGLGGEKYWLSTDTITAFEDETLDKEWQSFYPSFEWYSRLRDAKLAVDPCNLFSTDMTIPLKDDEIRDNCVL